jgi:hypothetical protein
MSVDLGRNQLYTYSSLGSEKSEWRRVTLRATADTIKVIQGGKETSSAKPGVSPGPITFKPAPGLELRNIFLNDLSAK